MNNKIIKPVAVILSVFVFLIFSCELPATDTPPSQTEGPTIDVVTGASIHLENNTGLNSLESSEVGSPHITKDLEIINSGDENLIISKIEFNDKSYYAVSSNLNFPVSINPEGSLPVEFTFNPSAVGEWGDELHILSNDTINSLYIINYTAIVTESPKPILDVVLAGSNISIDSDSTALSLGTMLKDDPYTSISIDVQNKGTADLTISDLALSVGTQYAISSTHSFPEIVTPGNFMEVELTFTPSTLGEQTCALTISSDDEDTPSFIVNYTAIVTESPKPILDVVLAGSNTSIDSDSTALSLGTMLKDDPDTSISIDVQNKGTADLTISDLALSVGTQYAISSTHSFPEIVTPGNSMEVELTFTPSTLGEQTCALTISSDDEVTPSFIVNYTVTVNEPPVITEPILDVVLESSGVSIDNNGTAISLGSYIEGDSPGSILLEIQNDGNADLSISNMGISNGTYYSYSTGAGFSGTIVPTDSASIEITIDPSAPGTLTSALTFDSNDSKNSSFTVNFTADVDAALPQLEAKIDGDAVRHNETAFDFGRLAPSVSSTASVLLENTGNVTLEISDIDLSDDTAFTLDPALSFPIFLNVGESKTFTVEFNSTVENTYNSQIEITNNSSLSPFLINLTGECNPDPTYTITVDVDGKNTNYTFVCWIEDLLGNNIQNLRVCKKANPKTDGLSGIGLPIWSRPLTDPADPSSGGAIHEHPDDVDDVTSPTVHGEFEIEQPLAFDPSVKKFTILFEVDRSWNDNSYFPDDRPSFLYQSEPIDLDALESSYSLDFAGWMCNDTINTGASYDQHPGDLADFPFFDTYVDVPFNFRTEREYIEDSAGNIDDMINSITVIITED